MRACIFVEVRQNFLVRIFQLKSNHLDGVCNQHSDKYH